ncbi:hypothetical protein NDU88_003497 [Pleurodeles waltl]|uniref:Uncharacterized protein n=1 Tax=Pleurodeles waltl TaxID=8319 RepID=A0AAV7SDM5_PLEWA|nr:hypothetical protein NDU88_003497 [Pleurodeles waltl]
MSFCCLPGAASWRAWASCGAKEDPVAGGLDPVGAWIGATWSQFGGIEVVLAWQFQGAAWALSDRLNCGPGEEGWGALLVGRGLEIWDKAGTGRSVKHTKEAARASGVGDMDWRKRRESQTQISANGVDVSNDRVETQQDGTMVVVVPGMTEESTESLDARMALVSVDT